jgi:hypothetical protein
MRFITLFFFSERHEQQMIGSMFLPGRHEQKECCCIGLCPFEQAALPFASRKSAQYAAHSAVF